MDYTCAFFINSSLGIIFDFFFLLDVLINIRKGQDTREFSGEKKILNDRNDWIESVRSV